MSRAKTVYHHAYRVDKTYGGLLRALQEAFDRRAVHKVTIGDALRKDQVGRLFCLRLRRGTVEGFTPAVTEGWQVWATADYPIGEVCSVDPDRDEVWVIRSRPAGARTFENPIEFRQPDFLARFRDWLEERGGRPLPRLDSRPIEVSQPTETIRGKLRESQFAVLQGLLPGVNRIWGPPGTGKTYTISWTAYHLAEQGYRVAVLAPTNVAVDNAVLGIRSAFEAGGQPLKGGDLVRAGYPVLSLLEKYPELLSWQEALTYYTEELQQIRRQIQKLSSLLGGRPNPNLKAQLELLKQEDKELDGRRSHALWSLARHAKLLATTVYSALHRPEMRAFFSAPRVAVIIDEAAMVPRYALLPLIELLKGGDAPQGSLTETPEQVLILLAGDPKQLAPIYNARTREDVNARYWLGESLMEELLDHRREDFEAADGLFVLRQQTRMDASICRKISRLHYFDLLRTLPDPERPRPPLAPNWPGEGIVLLCPRLAPLPADAPDERLLERKGKIDQRSLYVALGLIRQALKAGARTVLWLTPFRDQARLAQKLVDTYFSRQGVRAGTIHTSQGREADLVVVDPVNLRHPWLQGRLGEELDIERLLNVAVSRARGQAIVLTNRNELRGNDIFRRLLHDAHIWA